MTTYCPAYPKPNWTQQRESVINNWYVSAGKGRVLSSFSVLLWVTGTFHEGRNGEKGKEKKTRRTKVRQQDLGQILPASSTE